MDRSWIKTRKFSQEHINGVTEFMNFVRETYAEDANILCLCRKCLNRIQEPQGKVKDHLLIYGMASTYDRWIHHGEPLNVESDAGAQHVDEATDFMEDVAEEDVGLEEEDEYEDDRIPDMIEDLYSSEDPSAQQPMFAKVIEEAKRTLCEGSEFSRFSFVVKLLHIKSFYRISNVAFNALLTLLTAAFPRCSIPKSYDEALKFIRALGLGYVSIHVCPNNCVLFRKQYANNDECPVCGASRWKDSNGKKQIPEKVLRHFPLILRLQRMFSSKKSSEELQWHKLKRKPVDNELSHPADGEAWKDFDRKHEDFAKDARNIRLGLATDGFNPFGNMSTSYSMWPVFVVPYNLPPWACMDQCNLMMTLLIPGPKSPGKDFDLFLEPLVEELIELWKGVSMYDAFSAKKFDLRAAIVWCIHDFPALSTLSGRITRGYYACVRCDKDPCSVGIRNKICYIGHRRFLPRAHRWRRSKDCNGETETRDKPTEFSREELQQQLEKVKDVRPGKHPQNKKRKRKDDCQCWSRRVSLWDLPYWIDLKLRHNLDVMHIEKNICDNLLGTFLNINGKTKDTANARLDLEDMDIRSTLHLERDDNGNPIGLPAAWYTMTKEQKLAFCEFIREVRFPDGYASNLAKCVTPDGCKLQGLKTHDCHILLQRLILVGIRGIIHKEIYEAVADLGNFFRELCCKTLKLDVLQRLKAEIPIILCKLEKNFPPAFFDVMVHLAVHLPDEAILRGPVQYGWIYPIERRLRTCKRYVRNMARPEGSIAEAYVVDECLTFCSRYFDDVETRFNREGRNKECADLHSGDLSVFNHGVNLLGGSKTTIYAEGDYDKMVWYVLNNCTEVQAYIELCKEELEREDSHNVDKRLEKGFAKWFKNHVSSLHEEKREEVSDDLYALACGPAFRVISYSACIVDGVRYHTTDREKNKKTQNSGVMVEGTHDSGVMDEGTNSEVIADKYIDFYGQLKEIIKLQYNSTLGVHRSVVLFRCDWFDLDAKKTRLKDDGHFKSINIGKCWYKNDPFILAMQSTKLFYLQDTKHGGNWRVVQKFHHRHLWSVTETFMEQGPNGSGLTYQDDDSEEVPVKVNEATVENLLREDQEHSLLDATIVAKLVKQRNELVDESESEDDDHDDTMMQYCSDNEDHTTDHRIPVVGDDDEWFDFGFTKFRRK